MLLVPAGASYRSAAVRAGWQTRRHRYGTRGISEEAVEVVAGALARQRHKRKTTCLRGHAMTPDNVLKAGKGRQCRACNRLRSKARRQRLTQAQAGGRPEWVTVGTARVHLATHDAFVIAQGRPLWTRMLDAHPDRGGTQRKFEAARRQWDRWLAQETAWYAAAGVPLPEGLKRRTDDTSREAA